MGFFMRIGIVAPSTPILPDDAEAARAVVSLGYPGVELEFDPQCFAIAGHFASEDAQRLAALVRSEEHTSELQSLMRISYAVFCLQQKTHQHTEHQTSRN